MLLFVEIIRQKSHNFLKPMAVDLVESAKLLAVDVEHSNHLIVSIEDWNYNLRARQRTASYVPGKLFHIPNNVRLALFPSRSTHSFAIIYAHASHRTLKRTEPKLVATHQIKARPPEIHLMVKH